MLIAVSEKIPSYQISLNSYLDIVLVELDVFPKSLVCCVYMPPGYDDKDFHQLLDDISLLPSHSDFLLLGDSNAPDVNWNTYCASSLRSSSLCDCFFNKNLIQMVTGPTHYLGKTWILFSPTIQIPVFITTRSTGQMTKIKIEKIIVQSRKISSRKTVSHSIDLTRSRVKVTTNLNYNRDSIVVRNRLSISTEKCYCKCESLVCSTSGSSLQPIS